MRSLDEITPGLLLGRYECLLPIARGGMAAVWAARVSGARGFEKTVAIKTLLPTLSDDSNVERMFLDEARIASLIRHPNVVEILDLGEQDGLLYLVMEFVDGEPLSVILRTASRRGGIPINIAVKVAMDASAGLHAAHELKHDGRALNLVHRDVSPQNIMISEDGIVKLVDFGVAKVVGRTAAETAAGEIKGKLNYLAPEQVTGRNVDRRTDIFALGVVLFQLTVGKHPFRGDTDGATLHNILRRRVPRPTQLVGGYPPELEGIVLRSLEREPEFRFQTAADLYKALDSFLSGSLRVTTDDVASFVRPFIAPEGEKFRKALRAASRNPNVSASNVAKLLKESIPPPAGDAGPDSPVGSSSGGVGSSSGLVRDKNRFLASTVPPPSPDLLSTMPPPQPRPPALTKPETASSKGRVVLEAAESSVSGSEKDLLPVRPNVRRNRILVVGIVGAAALITVLGIVVAKARSTTRTTWPTATAPLSSGPEETPSATASIAASAAPVESVAAVDSSAATAASTEPASAAVEPTATSKASTTKSDTKADTKKKKQETKKKWTSTINQSGID